MESRKRRLYSNYQTAPMRKPNLKNLLLPKSNELSNTSPFISFFHQPTKSEFESYLEIPEPIQLMPKENQTKNTQTQLQITTDNVEKKEIENSVKNSSKSRVKNRKTTRSIFKQALDAVVQQDKLEKEKTNNVPIANSSVSSVSSPAPRFCLNDKTNHQEEKHEPDWIDLSTTNGTRLALDKNKNEIDDLIEKISCLMNVYPSGVFEHQLPVYYKQHYNEKLTKSWVKLIDRMDLKLEPSVGSFNIITRK